jgi:DegV family protein with EDD domain
MHEMTFADAALHDAPPIGPTRVDRRRRAARGVSGYALRRALIAGIQRVIARRDEINRINVFPVPDGDTGTNLAFTLGSVLQAVRAGRQGHAGDLLRRAASEAIDGARGNSGAIMAQFLQGVSEHVGNARRVSAEALASAAAAGSRAAREAMAEPREGTILSVIQAFAVEWTRQAEAGVRDLRVAYGAALERARVALRATPDQLPVLKEAGVVDAGALGFVDLLEGIDDYIRQGRSALEQTMVGAASLDRGVDAASAGHGVGECHRWCTECMVSGDPVDRLALKAAILALPVSSVVIAGTREKIRVHAHVDDPDLLFEVCRGFGRVSSEKADDMHAQVESAHQSRRRVALVVDSGADIPADELERLNIHVVPVRISFGSRDYLDKVSLSSAEFFRELRESPVHPRTSQPPPGDFRRLFEFLLSHHDKLVYVGLSRALSGTLQSAESAAARRDGTAGRAQVVDSMSGAAAQGLLAIDAGEAALAGWSSDAIAARVRDMVPRTRLFAVVRDLTYGVRGGRAPKLALPLSRWLRAMPIIANKPSGKLGIGGVMWGRRDLPARFASKLAKGLDPKRRYRAVVCHCDVEADGQRLLSELRRLAPNLEQAWLMQAGSGIGAHAGPGSLVVGLQEIVPLGDAPAAGRA